MNYGTLDCLTGNKADANENKEGAVTTVYE